MGEEGTSVEKRKRAGALDRQEEEPWRVLLRGGENTVESNIGATKIPHQNGATECDVSGFRTTRRTCTVDTSQTKGILSLLTSGKKMKEDDEERMKASKRDGDLRKVRRREKRERMKKRKKERDSEKVSERDREREREREREEEGEQKKLTDTVTDVSNDGERHLSATGCPGAYSDRGCDPEKLDDDAAIRECETKRRV